MLVRDVEERIRLKLLVSYPCYRLQSDPLVGLDVFYQSLCSTLSGLEAKLSSH